MNSVLAIAATAAARDGGWLVLLARESSRANFTLNITIRSPVVLRSPIHRDPLPPSLSLEFNISLSFRIAGTFRIQFLIRVSPAAQESSSIVGHARQKRGWSQNDEEN